ncbi:MAG: CocE/NonD family hydrolase, partial [Anaerolineales bacterium]|nr:CocE/NonD family hydrolase [Anaerolineales bacterium]
TYDPAEPTPHAGGALLGAGAGPVDNRALEARADVLTFTLPPLAQDIEVIGPVFADLYVRSSLAYTDFFCRLCDVWPDGRSVNVCDGLVSVSPEVGEPRVDGSLRVRVGMAATAYRFRRGHALRLQVSSGAFPRYNRNLGLGESPWRGVRMRAAAQEVFHDRERPSALVLPA